MLGTALITIHPSPPLPRQGTVLPSPTRPLSQRIFPGPRTQKKQRKQLEFSGKTGFFGNNWIFLEIWPGEEEFSRNKHNVLILVLSKS